MVIENAIAAMPGWRPSFYRTSNGTEVDLILSRGRQRIVVECKASAAPTVSRGFWNVLDDVAADEAFVIAPVDEPYPLRKGVQVVPLSRFVQEKQGDRGRGHRGPLPGEERAIGVAS